MASTVFSNGSNGAVDIPVDLTSFPPPYNGAVLAGQTWNFQVWHRDVGSPPTSSFTEATAISFQ